MNWTDFGAALALVLVLEGLLPFLNPAAWRKMALLVVTLDERRIRRWGLMLMIGGTLLLSLIKKG